MSVRIKKLKLNNFRRFEEVEIDLDHPLIVIQADNAEGKSTILEAVYYLTNQHSPFTSEVSEIRRIDQLADPYFRIEAVLDIDEEEKIYSLFQSKNSRLYSIDDHRTTRKKFEEMLASTIFSPEQIELLMISPQRRRDFLDAQIYKIDPDHEGLIRRSRQILKHRNGYLKRLSKRFYENGTVPTEDQQLEYWSDMYAKVSTSIIIDRLKYIEQITNDDISLTYIPSIDDLQFIEMVGEEELIKSHMENFRNTLRRDVALGHTTIGAHRDDWEIIMSKNIRKHGSRGEKRLAIGRILMNSQDIYFTKHGHYPTLLLDDISSELDEENTRKILHDKFLDRQQTIITTIKLEDIPQEIKDRAFIITLRDLQEKIVN